MSIPTTSSPLYSTVTWLLASGRRPGDRVLLADLGLTLDQRWESMDRQRHEFVGLAAGEAEHHALVARALAVHACPTAMCSALLVERDHARRRNRRRSAGRCSCSRSPGWTPRTTSGDVDVGQARSPRRRRPRAPVATSVSHATREFSGPPASMRRGSRRRSGPTPCRGGSLLRRVIQTGGFDSCSVRSLRRGHSPPLAGHLFRLSENMDEVTV